MTQNAIIYRKQIMRVSDENKKKRIRSVRELLVETQETSQHYYFNHTYHNRRYSYKTILRTPIGINDFWRLIFNNISWSLLCTYTLVFIDCLNVLILEYSLRFSKSSYYDSFQKSIFCLSYFWILFITN